MKKLILLTLLFVSGCKFDEGQTYKTPPVLTTQPISSHCVKVENGYVYCTAVFVYRPETK